MGVIETGILNQAKKGQAETNERLDALIAEQKRTNELLDRLDALIASRSPNA